MGKPFVRLIVNLVALAILVAILASPMILASNTTSQGAPWMLTSDIAQGKVVSIEIKDVRNGSQEVVLDLKPTDFSSEYKSVLSVFNVTNATIEVSIEKINETNANLSFEAGKKVATLKPGEKKSIDLTMNASATSSKSTARFILKSI